MVVVEVAGRKFEVEEVGRGKAVESPFIKGAFVFRHTVRVKTLDGQKGQFTYYGSIADYEKGKRKLDEHDLIFAFYSFLSDCNAAMMSFGEFANLRGFKDCGEAYTAWTKCKRLLRVARKLGVVDEELPDILNELQERYDL